ncbi:MAG: CdaR family protein [Desulfobulbaceae bacterium]|nr:CdaR family protein [Desulfobulbaceae bacterium]
MRKFPELRLTEKNWLLKAISVCLAIMLWYFVVGEDQVDITVQVPIEVINLPSSLTISNQYRKNIEVSVRGPRSLVQDLKNRNISRPVDLSNAQPGTIVIKNEGKSIPFPKGITVLRLQPSNITILLDKLVQKSFPIQPVTEGELAKGYVLESLYLDPDHLVISGPKSLIDKDMSLKTYVIDLEGLDRSTTLQVHLDLEQEFLDLIGETVVSAMLQVREKLVEHTIENIPVNVRESNIPVAVEPDTVTVQARIPENLIRETPEPAMLFRAYVSAKDIRIQRHVPVTISGVNVPGHDPVQILSAEPKEVLVIPLNNNPLQ